MPRQIRVEYPGAIYHVMSRGDRREDIFHDDVDRQEFLKTLAKACQKTGFQMDAYYLHHIESDTPAGRQEFERRMEPRRDQATAEGKGERIIGEELARLKWRAVELAQRPKSDSETLAIVARLRRETILPVGWIAQRPQMGTRKSLSTRLQERKGRLRRQ